jgi:putative tryptophan/tyrosine transport system substrate-binding protein
MRRRDFTTLLGGAAAWVATARAQEPRRVIGVLGSTSLGGIPGSEAAFIQGLKDFIEGKNIRIEWRWAEGRYSRLPSLIGELVGSNVAVIVTLDAPSSFAAKTATRTIPIVFAIGTDPVKLGLVESFNQPRSNLTGVTSFLSSLGAKQLELLHELLPGASTIAFLVNTGNQNSKIDASEVQAAADSLGQHLEVLTASTENELEMAFTTMVRQRVDAVVVKPDPFFIYQRERLVALAAQHSIPTINSLRVFTEAGGLISYGTRLWDAYERAGTYTGKILRGAKPADLPVYQSIKFELIVNLKAAKALGLTIPATLLSRTDEVVE